MSDATGYKLEKVFVLLCLLFGGLFAIMMPVMQIQDEDTHTMRAANISYLNFVGYKEGVNIPSSIYAYLDAYT